MLEELNTPQRRAALSAGANALLDALPRVLSTLNDAISTGGDVVEGSQEAFNWLLNKVLEVASAGQSAVQALESATNEVATAFGGRLDAVETWIGNHFPSWHGIDSGPDEGPMQNRSVPR